jgi:hypothetical protein
MSECISIGWWRWAAGYLAGVLPNTYKSLLDKVAMLARSNRTKRAFALAIQPCMLALLNKLYELFGLVVVIKSINQRVRIRRNGVISQV